MSTADRTRRTQELLREIRNSTDEKERNRKAWQVVMLNEAAAVWIAQRYRLDKEDGPADARIALYHAALYCDPDKGSYLMVAKWIFLRYHLSAHTRAGIHVPIAALMRVFRKKDAPESEPEANAVAKWAVWGYPNNAVPERGMPAEDVDESTPVDISLDVQRLEKLVAKLTPVEKAVIQTITEDGVTLRSVCEDHDVSREWGRRVRRGALDKLRVALRVPRLIGDAVGCGIEEAEKSLV